ncbi:branched-chain amino acid ABC transporter ATP-binding protein/permease [Streptacidiphilus carbonis]|uniref:branched-chain amino acid ABC transporter ATP-binding protein/permease n=1 Tax=Streptacidiphilus carbonis TaxID=105422 RepID=UPI0005A8DB11|nr:branched-chain amino acid ABC transporter ATP-binding protein/permease [Streptacidiphilus carbonis]
MTSDLQPLQRRAAVLRRPDLRRLGRPAGYLVLAVLAWLLPYGLGGYDMHVLDTALVFAILAIGQGLVMGIAGQINLAQVAFMGVGAYTTAILTTQEHMAFWPAAVLAVAAAALMGLLIGLPALRVQSHYLGIVTLGLSLAFLNWVTNAPLAGSGSGLSGIPVPPLGGVDLTNDYLYYYVELLAFVAALAFGLFVVRTRLGRRMRAMRDDSLAAGSLGARIPVLRMTAFLLAGVYGGVAGVLYAGLIRFVAPETFSITEMFLLLAMVVIGGRQSLWGCVVGALALSAVQEELTDLSTYAQLGYGAVVVLMVVFAPTGLAGVPHRLRTALQRRAPGPESATVGPFRPYPPAEPRPDAGTLLQLDAITMRFKGLVALSEVSLQVRAGEIRGVVGPNGSGKTTLFNIISGLYRASAGTVALQGRQIGGMRPYRLAHLGLARTFQNLRLFRRLTVREHLLAALDRSPTRWAWRYVLWPVGVWRGERDLGRQADALLDRFGLAAFAGAIPYALPYGIQRRVELARAMAGSPQLLLLDEPAAGLNGTEKAQLVEIVKSIRDSGTTVVIIEHDMGLVMSLCEQVTVLAAGRVIAHGSPAQVAADPQVIEAYLGRAAADRAGQEQPVTTPSEEPS